MVSWPSDFNSAMLCPHETQTPPLYSLLDFGGGHNLHGNFLAWNCERKFWVASQYEQY
jgi:hypothetical protein